MIVLNGQVHCGQVMKNNLEDSDHKPSSAVFTIHGISPSSGQYVIHRRIVIWGNKSR